MSFLRLCAIKLTKHGRPTAIKTVFLYLSVVKDFTVNVNIEIVRMLSSTDAFQRSQSDDFTQNLSIRKIYKIRGLLIAHSLNIDKF